VSYIYRKKNHFNNIVNQFLLMMMTIGVSSLSTVCLPLRLPVLFKSGLSFFGYVPSTAILALSSVRCLVGIGKFAWPRGCTVFSIAKPAKWQLFGINMTKLNQEAWTIFLKVFDP
jgi:hypothetical protein